MTKTELQLALAKATQTNQKTAGVFLDTLSALAYKTTKKNGEFVLPGFGKLVKQKRKARTGFNPKTQQTLLTIFRLFPKSCRRQVLPADGNLALSRAPSFTAFNSWTEPALKS